MTKQSERVKVVARILKKKFTDLTNTEAIHIGYLIVEALDKQPDKVTNNE